MSCSVIARALFEARVNLAEISRDPNKFSEQYTRYKEVAKLRREHNIQIIDERRHCSQNFNRFLNGMT